MGKTIDQTAAWKKLLLHFEDIQNLTLRELFSQTPERGQNLTLEHDGIYVDYSKNRLNSETMRLLQEAAQEVDVAAAAKRMFNGEKINTSEDRAVLHIAQRALPDAVIKVDGENVIPKVHAVLKHMAEFSERIRSGEWKGFSGKPIRNVVHIGIGGAEIGPHMACETLANYSQASLNAFFVSNIDPDNFFDSVRGLDPAETLFIISSKSFTTVETLTNALTAKQWVLDAADGDQSVIAKHFVTISTNTEAVREFGIDTDNMFEMWDWVGGRYSLMGATGLIIMIMIGPDNFYEILAGARAIDEHFTTASIEKNIPITLALISTWYSNFFGTETELLVAYSALMDRMTTYLQQANMESNGKSVKADGTSVSVSTGPIIWGKPGTDAQHTFMQHVHQGTHLIPADILIFKESFKDVNGQHTMLIANALAQAEALAFGKTAEELEKDGDSKAVIPHKVMPGNRPSNTIVIPKLTPYTFGQLIAIYEHKIFVQGVLWGIDSFDQWGVQLGKLLATNISDELTGKSTATHDSSTATLINRIKS